MLNILTTFFTDHHRNRHEPRATPSKEGPTSNSLNHRPPASGKSKFILKVRAAVAVFVKFSGLSKMSWKSHNFLKTNLAEGNPLRTWRHLRTSDL